MKRKTIIGLSALAGVAIAVFVAPWRTSAVGPQSSCFRVPRYDTTGVWTARRVADGMLGYEVISPEVNGRSTSIVGIPNEDPTYGTFPDVTTMTDYVGHRVRTGHNSWDVTWIGYGCAAPAGPGLYGEVVWIGIMRAAQSCTDHGNALHEAIIFELYSARHQFLPWGQEVFDQDTNMDGLPDAGEVPIFSVPLEITVYRLPMLPLP